jgi:hypothetical protein
MAYPDSVDLQVRVAGEKALYPDEFLTRSQPIPGTNISFDYLSNGDIRINANVGPGGDNVIIIDDTIMYVGPRMMTGVINCDVYNYGEFNEGAGHRHIAVDDTARGQASDRKYFGTAMYADIVHNWDLTDEQSWILNLVDITEGISSPISYQGFPKVVALDNNTIRVWVTVSLSVHVPANWRANANTLVGIAPNTAYTTAYPKFQFTLQEYK